MAHGLVLAGIGLLALRILLAVVGVDLTETELGGQIQQEEHQVVLR